MRGIKIIISYLLVVVPMLGVAQKNETDDQGRKQGMWEVFYDDTRIVAYRGEFKDDRPVGEFIRYYSNGNVKTVSDCEYDKFVCRTTFYDQNQNRLAKGKYTNQRKDSTWVYFDKHGNIQLKENYKNGQLEGVQEKYYRDGSVAERKTFKDSLAHGEWRQYHPEGKIRAVGAFKDGNLDGEVKYYYEDGKIKSEGQYKNAVKDGRWMHFLPNGKIHYQEVYRDGHRTKFRMQNGEHTTYYDSNLPEKTVFYENGKRQGVFKEFYPIADVTVSEIDDYEDRFFGDKRQNVENQKIKVIGNYEDDQLHGEVKYFSEEGKLQKVEVYEMGELVDTKKK